VQAERRRQADPQPGEAPWPGKHDDAAERRDAVDPGLAEHLVDHRQQPLARAPDLDRPLRRHLALPADRHADQR
jgi:hypothetical protein